MPDYIIDLLRKFAARRKESSRFSTPLFPSDANVPSHFVQAGGGLADWTANTARRVARPDMHRTEKPTQAHEPGGSQEPARLDEPVGLEEQGGEGGAGLGYPWVSGREDLEELDQVDAGLVALLAGCPAHDAEEPVERLVHQA
jgi:hypothetical protein